MISKCLYCGRDFEQRYKTQKYCSKSCKGKHQVEISLNNKMTDYYKSPKICPKCNNPIPFEKRNNKFCSRSCAATHVNLNRVRTPWTTEQKIKLSEKTTHLSNGNRIGYKKYICKYCGCVTPNKRLCCEECKQYLNYTRTFKKLGLTQGSLKNRFDNTQKLLCEEYFDNKESLCTLVKKYNLDVTTIYRFIKNDPRGCRSISDGLKLAIEEGRLDFSKTYHNSFITGQHKSWDGKVYTYRSSWEDKYMNILDERKVNYMFEPFHIEYYDSIKNTNRYAFPDFYLPDTNEIIELKSTYTLDGKIQEMKDKFKAYEELGYKPKLLLDWEFVDIDKLEENLIKTNGLN